MWSCHYEHDTHHNEITKIQTTSREYGEQETVLLTTKVPDNLK